MLLPANVAYGCVDIGAPVDVDGDRHVGRRRRQAHTIWDPSATLVATLSPPTVPRPGTGRSRRGRTPPPPRVARVEGRQLQGGEGFGGRRGGGLGPRVVADHGQHAAGGGAADVVGVADGVGGPVQTGRLSVPDADHPIEAGRTRAHQLAAQKRGGGQLLVDPRLVDYPVLARSIGVTLQLDVQDAERELDSRRRGGPPQPNAAVPPSWAIKLDQRLHPGQKGRPWERLYFPRG